MTKMIPAVGDDVWINVSIEGARQINSGGSSMSPLEMALFVLVVPALAAAVMLTAAGWAGARAGLAGSGQAAVALAWAPACSRRSSTSPRPLSRRSR